jgi:hypothetical protein
MSLVGLRLAVAADDQGRCRTQAANDVLERLDRDLGPVKVLQDEDKRLAAGDACERARQKLEDLDPVLGSLFPGGSGGACLAAGGRPQFADLGKLREEGDELRRKVGDVGALGGRTVWVAGPEVVLEQLAESLVGKRAVLLDEAAVEDADLRTRARFCSSSSSRVLPIPGSPATTANWQLPARAAFKRLWSSANSFSRPMNADGAGRGITRLPVKRTDLRNSSEARLDLWRRSASASCPALWGRRAGSFWRHLRIASCKSSRISAPSVRGGWGISWTMR